MIMKKVFFLLIATVALSSCCQTKQETVFTVASYNLRNDNQGDRDKGNGWDKRCQVVVKMIQFHDFDIFGTQELFNHQIKDLLQELPDYNYVGVARDDGAESGEYSAIFYNTKKFELMDQGNFWLSETPDKPGLGWDAVCIRICSWGHFKFIPTGKEFLFFNLHMDHIGTQARVESAYLVQQKMEELGKGLPCILTGDFNVDQTHQSYNAIVEKGVLKDCYEATAFRYIETGTFNNFDPNVYTESRIDHIFLSPVFDVLKYGVLTDTYRSEVIADEVNKVDAPEEIELKKYEARTPSDHYPVKAVIKMP